MQRYKKKRKKNKPGWQERRISEMNKRKIKENTKKEYRANVKIQKENIDEGTKERTQN